MIRTYFRRTVLIAYFFISQSIIFAQMPNDNSFVCYYLFDSKYDEHHGAQRQQQWIDSILQRSAQTEDGANLFSHRGGGPNGAEWNPMANLLVLAQFSGNLETAKATMLINNRPDKKLLLTSHFSKTKQITSFYCIIPRKRWETALRSINTADYKSLFGTNNLDSLQQQLSAPPDAATIVEIKIIISKGKTRQEVKGFFMAAFGE